MLKKIKNWVDWLKMTYYEGSIRNMQSFQDHKFARSYCLLIEQNGFASTLVGILNWECAIRPPGNNVANILDEAITKTIWPSLI